MEATLKYRIPQSVMELAELIKSRFTAKEQLKLVQILQKEPEEDEYEDIYYSWFDGKKFITFRNCEVKYSDIQAIDWGN